jgi:hypothetical protein
LQTEEAHTAPAHSLVFELGAEYIAAEPNPLTRGERGRYDGPIGVLTYSPADPVEFDLEWVARVGTQNDPDFGNVSDWGDVTLRAKLRFTGNDRKRPALGARFSVSLPETRFGEGLGTNTLRLSVQALGSFPLGRGFIHGNAGVAILDDPARAHAQNDFFAWGLAVEQPIASSVSLLAEASGLAGKSGSAGADETAEARAGVRVTKGRWRWDLALRHGLKEADGRLGVAGGFTYRIRPRP